MNGEEMLKQYDTMGKDYVNYQRKFFSNKEDWTRTKLRAELKRVKGPVLDIGCSAGDDVKWCEGNGIEAFGIEPSETMYELAKENVGHPENIKIGGYENIPFSDNFFGLIMGRFSMHYLNKFSKAHREMARTLKPGGKLLLAVSHPIFDTFTISRTREALVAVKLYGGKVTVTFPPHNITDYLSEEFMQLFDLKELDESASIDAENPEQIPETLFITAKKRQN
ncbi:MAG: class I SAM-dependent methyltransferase [Candidatus Berkelbacteria bacterium]|nr:MAG: class I SAM-dependent methyltransferase [Candidatus Berkelbacteria bacterium]QQG51816.1 MAG: class I SAM-dependent methyltransferase [Candidatus Berkelbacteria bacterium]